MDKIILFLKALDIFEDVTSEEISIIYPYLKGDNYKKNTVIFKEGDSGDNLYIVYKGSVSSHCLLANGAKRIVAEFFPGDFFGEMAIFEDAERSATCMTNGKSHLITLSKLNFFQIVENYPSIAIKVMNNMLRIITQRLKNRSTFLSDLVQWGEKARKRAIIDDVTGIYNRRYLDDSLDDLIAQSCDRENSLIMVMIDIDNFRKIVETFTLDIVNSIVIEIVQIFKKHLHKTDIFARYGGDEFSILMPGMDISDACETACKICESIAGHDFSYILGRKYKQVTVSMGVASFPGHAENSDELQQCADKALYQAKKAGKNRVSIYKK